MASWIESLDSAKFWIYATFWIVGSLYLFTRAFSALHKKRLINDTPTSLLRSAAQGYTELTGRGIHIDGPMLYSPLSGRECLWYRVKTEDISDHNNRYGYDLGDIFRLFGFSNKSSLVNINVQESDDLFYLDDDTGRCVIDPEGADITPSTKRIWYGNSPVPSRGSALKGSAIGNRYKYTEELLLPRDILYAIGDLKTQGGAGSMTDMREEARDLLVEWKRDHRTLLERFDRNNDGEISESEWERARKNATEEITSKHSGDDVPLIVTLLKQTNDSRRPFMISSDPLHDLIDKYQKHTLLFFIASLAAISTMLWVINIRF